MYSPSADLDCHLTLPKGWPEQSLLCTDDPSSIPPLELIDPAGFGQGMVNCAPAEAHHSHALGGRGGKAEHPGTGDAVLGRSHAVMLAPCHLDIKPAGPAIAVISFLLERLDASRRQRLCTLSCIMPRIRIEPCQLTSLPTTM